MKKTGENMVQVPGYKTTTTFIFFMMTWVFIIQSSYATALQDCMMEAMENANDNMTIGELRQHCEQLINVDQSIVAPEKDKDVKLVEERMRQDRQNVLLPFTLMAHKPNYVIIAGYNASSYNSEHYEKQHDLESIDIDDVEAKFQLSIKFPLLVNLFNGKVDIYAAYTNRSFWQVYNSDISSPFRETNHEPEAWVQFHPGWEFLGFTNTWNSFGVNHQSNGRGGYLSRSWNRIFAWLTVERGNLAMSFKPWYRISEDAEDDDNPNITDYMGHYELSASYKWGENVFSIMSRNNLESNFKRGAIELSWSFPIWNWPYLKGYVQYFNGYGESLIDYDQHVNSIGFGFSLTDWL
ncbi:MAG: phospholipase A [Deltaproteobacteria bacterium]|uniref:phospholipase A n=1 Tax=Desulfobacula sp. TaxID=2593537 RepID=UPI0019933130|nr:phospholipase A [Candidatus Desulfobacula maris]MBL6995636.1 phospholipase A [Desulfobacula sp.]